MQPIQSTPFSSVWPAVPAIVFFVLVLIQGGYYPLASGMSAFVLSSAAIAHMWVNRNCTKKRGAAITCGLALLLSVWCIARPSLDNFTSYTMLGSPATVILGSSCLLYLIELNEEERGEALNKIIDACALLNVIGAVILVGFFEFPGSWLNDRFQFTFQYANTAGLFFAISSILMLVGDRSYKTLLFLDATICLLATKSIGSITVWAIVISVMCLLQLHKRPDPSFPLFRRAFIPFFLFVFLVGFALLFPDRITNASQTIIDRFIQIYDGFRLFTSSPVMGIGPQEWRNIYPQIQSAQYQANVIHCGYLDFALSYGLIGIFLLISTSITWMKEGAYAAKSKINRTPLIAASCIVLLHAAIDIDLSFGSIWILGVVLLCATRTPKRTSIQIGKNSPFAIPLISALGLICLALLSTTSVAKLESANFLIESGRLDELHNRLSNDWLLANDRSVRSSLYEACTTNGFEQLALEVSNELPLEVDSFGRMSLFVCMYKCNLNAQAEDLILKQLGQEPYNLEAFSISNDLFCEFGLTAEGQKQLREIIECSNKLTQQYPASFLNNQVTLSLNSVEQAPTNLITLQRP